MAESARRESSLPATKTLSLGALALVAPAAFVTWGSDLVAPAAFITWGSDLVALASTNHRSTPPPLKGKDIKI